MSPTQKPTKFTIALDFRVLCIVLLLVIAGMLAAWRPWQRTTSNRTISVVGEAKLQAEPDEFVFYPNYQFENADKAAALAQLSAKSTEIINELKKLGVAENKIKTDSSGSDYKTFSPDGGTSNPMYMLTLTVTVNSREAAQKVSDYLVTTNPLGSVSPQPSFSDAKRKELETQARDAAVKDARSKAEQNAGNIDAKLDKVKEVTDGQGFDGGPIPIAGTALMRGADVASSSPLNVMPGESELYYTVNVTYFVR